MPQLLDEQPIGRFRHPAARQLLWRQDQAGRSPAVAANKGGLAQPEDILGDLETQAICAPIAMVDLDDADDNAVEPALGV